jgi:hypothetical protein
LVLQGIVHPPLTPPIKGWVFVKLTLPEAVFRFW